MDFFGAVMVSIQQRPKAGCVKMQNVKEILEFKVKISFGGLI